MAYEDRIMRMAANRRRNEGIANPHIRERRLRSLRTPSEQTIGPVGRGPLSVAEAAYHRGNVGKRSTGLRKDIVPTNFNDLLKKWYSEGYEFNPRPNLKGRFQEPMPIRFPQSGPAGAPVEGPWNKEYDTPYQGVFNDATTMAKDLAPTNFNDLLEKWHTNPDVSGIPTLAPELYEGFEPIHTGYAEALANINNPEYANKWNMTNPRQPGLDEELMEDYVPPRPRWDNWLGNLVRSIGGRYRGGLASLKYAR